MQPWESDSPYEPYDKVKFRTRAKYMLGQLAMGFGVASMIYAHVLFKSFIKPLTQKPFNKKTGD